MLCLSSPPLTYGFLTTLVPKGSVFCTKRSWGEPNPSYAVKLVKDDALAEPDVYDYLLDDLGNPRNHTLPCEVVHSNPSLIIMPFANNMVDALGPWGRVYDYMYQILEVRPSLSIYV